MREHEARDVGTLAGATLKRATRVLEGAHRATNNAVHDVVGRLVGPAVVPSRAISDAIASGVYAATGVALDAAARAGGGIAAYRISQQDRERPSVHDGRAAHHAIAIGTGLWGDTVARKSATIAPALQIRAEGALVEPTAEGLARAYPRASGAIVVFLHGLFETEAAWRLGQNKRTPYAARLAEDLGTTSVMLRYNTGLRISDNGADLDRLLGRLVAGWPVPPRRLVLVGHSMGGLVLHSALAVATARAREGVSAPPEEAEWLSLVTDTITLGTPHHGSPVARAVAGAAERLDRSTKSRWLADALHLRSGGVRDLEHGNIVAEDWARKHPTDRTDSRTHPTPAGGIRHHAIVAVTVAGRLPDHLAEAVGDFLVPVRSASHADVDTEVRRFSDDKVVVLRGVGHLGLLNSGRAYDAMLGWLRG